MLIRDKLFIGGVAYGGGSIQVAIENAKKQKKKSIVLSNNEKDVKHSQVNSGSALPVRSNPDTGTHDNGSKLVNLCKSSGHINGRHHETLDNDFTYSGPRGMSIIDYLLTKQDNFDIICKFIMCNFIT